MMIDTIECTVIYLYTRLSVPPAELMCGGNPIEKVNRGKCMKKFVFAAAAALMVAPDVDTSSISITDFPARCPPRTAKPPRTRARRSSTVAVRARETVYRVRRKTSRATGSPAIRPSSRASSSA